jgi:maleamate amidohydrolase
MDWNQEITTMRQARAAKPRLGHGTNPAVVIIDFQRAFTEHAGCGQHTMDALKATAELLDTARAHGVPVIHVALVVSELEDRMLAQRMRSSLTAQCRRGDPQAELHPLVPRLPGDHYVEKSVASAFYNTSLDALLAELGVDEIVLCGTSISGCVRATAVDAAYRSYFVSLVEECCDDFRPLSREASLWDIADRFGDVVPLAEMTHHFEQRSALTLAAQKG